MPRSTVRRLLRSIPHTSQNLVVRVLLADDIQGHQGVHPKVPKMPAARWHYSSQCNAPPLQPTSGDLRCLGHWLHGTIPKVSWQRIHPYLHGLCVKMGGSSTIEMS
jgi:hypothetical protein